MLSMLTLIFRNFIAGAPSNILIFLKFFLKFFLTKLVQKSYYFYAVSRMCIIGNKKRKPLGKGPYPILDGFFCCQSNIQT